MKKVTNLRLKLGGDIIRPNADIIRGAKKNDLSVVRQALLDDPSSIRHFDGEGHTALHIAARRGNLTMVRELLGAQFLDLSMRDLRGRDAVDLAIQAGHPDIVKLMLHRRAEGLGLGPGWEP